MNTPRLRLLAPLFAFFIGSAAIAAPAVEVTRPTYEHGGDAYAPAVVKPAGATGLPGVLMVPNWMGVTDAAVTKASKIAAMGYVVYVADVYTAAVRPQNPAEAGRAAGAIRADRALQRARTLAALEHFRSLATETGVPADRYAAIGFCFGGGTVLELARAEERPTAQECAGRRRASSPSARHAAHARCSRSASRARFGVSRRGPHCAVSVRPGASLTAAIRGEVAS